MPPHEICDMRCRATVAKWRTFSSRAPRCPPLGCSSPLFSLLTNSLAVLILLLPACAGPGAHEQARAGTPSLIWGSGPIVALRGGTDWLATEPDDGLLGKRRRPSGVSLQAIIEDADGGSFFSNDELEQLRQQFVPGYKAGDIDDVVPVENLGQLRLRISIKRDKISRSLITGEPVSISEDDGVGLLGQGTDGISGRSAGYHMPASQRDTKQLPRVPALSKTSSDVHTAVQAAVVRARELAQRSESGVRVIDGGTKRARSNEGTDALLNYNPSLLGHAKTATPLGGSPKKLSQALSFQSAPSTRNTIPTLALPSATDFHAAHAHAAGQEADAPLHDVEGVGGWVDGGGGAGEAIMNSSIMANVHAASDAYVGWVAANVVPLPGLSLSRTRPAFWSPLSHSLSLVFSLARASSLSPSTPHLFTALFSRSIMASISSFYRNFVERKGPSSVEGERACARVRPRERASDG